MSTLLTLRDRTGGTDRGGLRRTLVLARANAVLMLRNKVTLLYGLVLPLLPLGLLAGTDGDEGAASHAVLTVLMTALLFPVYYNVLSLLVTRRDELVLKRLRTGETRDLELVVSLALPGTVVALAVGVAVVPAAAAFGARLPLNPVLYAVGLVASCVLFAAFAVWTAAWTRNAEAAQMTSMPVLLLAVVGMVPAQVLPSALAEVVQRTPIAALDSLVSAAWFGSDDGTRLGFVETWGVAVEPLAVLVAWTLLAVWLARTSMRWEPRS